MKRTPLKRTTRLKAKGGSRFKSYTPNRAYQAWVRERPCMVAFVLCDAGYCYGATECDHITTRGAGGADEGGIWPLCSQHHSERHARGIKSFAEEYGVNPKAVGEALWARYESEQGRSI